jgi:hypothetical protein
VTDSRGVAGKGHQVFKFSGDGKLLMTLGKAGVAGSGHDTFNMPTDVVTAPNGDIFVADGHRGSPNSRIVKLSKDGTYIKEWGRKGNGPDDISEPHTIAIDSRGRLFVGDRENNRIKIFDQEGTLLDTWKQFGRPSGIWITKDDMMYVADSESGPDNPGWRKGFRIGSARDGVPVDFIEDPEGTTPDHSGAEGVGVDAQGNVCGAVVRHGLDRWAKNDREPPARNSPRPLRSLRSAWAEWARSTRHATRLDRTVESKSFPRPSLPIRCSEMICSRSEPSRLSAIHTSARCTTLVNRKVSRSVMNSSKARRLRRV